jgi:hypothetical protein
MREAHATAGLTVAIAITPTKLKAIFPQEGFYISQAFT